MKIFPSETRGKGPDLRISRDANARINDSKLIYLAGRAWHCDLKKKTKTSNAKSIIDNLEDRVAKKVVSESLHLQKGESLTVETWNNGFALAKKVVIEARKIGAHPIMIFEDEDSYVESFKGTPKDSRGKMGEHEYDLLASTNAYFFIPNEVLEGYTKRLSPSDVDESTNYGDSWYEAAEKAKLRGARMICSGRTSNFVHFALK
jgi:hypothetical protein